MKKGGPPRAWSSPASPRDRVRSAAATTNELANRAGGGGNIATIHGLERSGDVTALVMELVEGPPEKSETIFAAWSDRSRTPKGHR
jgi:hypothetical protein